MDEFKEFDIDQERTNKAIIEMLKARMSMTIDLLETTTTVSETINDISIILATYPKMNMSDQVILLKQIASLGALSKKLCEKYQFTEKDIENEGE